MKMQVKSSSHVVGGQLWWLAWYKGRCNFFIRLKM